MSKKRPREHVRAQREGKERDEYMCAFCHKQVSEEERYLIQGVSSKLCIRFFLRYFGKSIRIPHVEVA